jgi:hypothetical protein
MSANSTTCCQLLEIAVHSERPTTITMCLRCEDGAMLQLANDNLLGLDREREHVLDLQRDADGVHHVVVPRRHAEPPTPQTSKVSSSVSSLPMMQSLLPTERLSIPPPRRPGWRSVAQHEQLRIKLLSVLVEVRNTYATYASSTISQREAWAHLQRQQMGEAYAVSTWGHLAFDHAGSRVATVDLGSRQFGGSDCLSQSLLLTSAAATTLGLSTNSHRGQIDAVLYYLPAAASSGACTFGGSMIAGACGVGVVSPPNATAGVAGWVRRYPHTRWHSNCFIRDQLFGGAPASNGAHEFGHYLGLAHASGSNGVHRVASGQLVECTRPPAEHQTISRGPAIMP